MAAPESAGCWGQHSACAVRFTRLGANCAPVPGDTGGAVIYAFGTGTTTPDVETGTKFEPKDACGRLVYADEDPDVVKRHNLDMEFHIFDFAAVEVITGSPVILGAAGTDFEGKIIGISDPGPESISGVAVGVEIWVKNASGAGPCGASGDFAPYTRHVWPRAILRLNDRTFDNTSATLKLTGTATPNPLWDDPWGDWQGATFDPLSPHVQAYDTADSLPAPSCGYITLPAGS